MYKNNVEFWFLQHYFYAAVIGLAIVGLLTPFEYNYLPVDRIFEGVLLVASLGLCFYRVSMPAFVIAWASLTYIFLSWLYGASPREVYYLDFLLAFKAFFFIAVLAPFAGKRVFSDELLKKFYCVLIVCFLLKYSYSVVFKFTYRMGERPGLFVENNFELVFLSVLFYVLRNKFTNIYHAFFWLALVTIISGSRSAILIIVALYFFVFFDKFDRRLFVRLMLVLPIIGAVYMVFSSRADSGIEDVDRFKFLMVFLDETYSWGILDYMLGAPRITELTPYSCGSLSFYHSLFSFSGDEVTCYSVILHSYLLRVIFDHGLLGLLFLVFSIWYMAKISCVKNKDFFCLLAVLLISGMSVSSFNSIFSTMAIIVLFCTYSDSGRGLSK